MIKVDPELDLIDQLLKLTPLGIEGIKAAWPFLSFDQKFTLLKKIAKCHFYRDLRDDLKVSLLQLEESAYLKSLISRGVTNFDTKSLDAVINESDHFVRYACEYLSEFDFWFDEPGEFWNLPYVERLYILSGEVGAEEQVVELFQFVLSESELSNHSASEIGNLLLEYLTWHRNAELPGIDRYTLCDKYLYFRNINAEPFWKLLLLPNLPASFRQILLCYLPPTDEEIGMPQDVLDSLRSDANELSSLLIRAEMPLIKIRKEIWDCDSSNSDDSRVTRIYSVCSPYIKFTTEQILAYRGLPEDSKEAINEKINRLGDLADSSGITIVQSELIQFLLREIQSTGWGSTHVSNYITDRRADQIYTSLKKMYVRPLSDWVRDYRIFIAIVYCYDQWWMSAKVRPRMSEYICQPKEGGYHFQSYLNIAKALEDGELTYESVCCWLPRVILGGDEYEGTSNTKYD